MLVPKEMVAAKRPSTPAKPTPIKAQPIAGKTQPTRAPRQFGGIASGTGSRVPEGAIRGTADGGVNAQKNASFQQHYGVITPIAAKDVNISQLEGNRNQNINYVHGFHTGTDFSAQVGTDTRSVKEGGVVKFSGNAGAYGNQVIIAYPDGSEAVLNHLSESLVKPGQSVAKGEVIAKTGNTGHTTGPHLDFEARKANTIAAPSDIWNQRSVTSDTAFGKDWQGAEGGVGNRSAKTGPSPTGGDTITASGTNDGSRNTSFDTGTNATYGGGTGQQINLSALGQVPMRGYSSKSPKSVPASAAPFEPAQSQSTNPGTTTVTKGNL